MKSRTALIAGLVVALAAFAAPGAVAEETPPNAIVSEGNGAAVFIGYGGTRSVSLSWTPSKQYETASMLYQVQRSDGAMLVSKTRAASYVDPNLQPNTNYGYRLTVFQSIVKNVTVNGEVVQKTITKRKGTNAITVLTLPEMVIGLTAVTHQTQIDLTWQPPQNAANSPITYSVKLDGNLMAVGLTTTTFSLPGLTAQSSYSVEVISENAAGMAKVNARLGLRTPK